MSQRLAARFGFDTLLEPVDGEDFVEIEGRKLFYQEHGDTSDPTVLFLHGAGGTPSHLPALIRAIASRGLQVIAPEHPGMGRSEHLRDYDAGFFESYARAYHRFLRLKDLREPIVIAQSFGGGPANALANLRLRDIESLYGKADAEKIYRDYRPRALVLVDAFMGQAWSRVGLRSFYGRLLMGLRYVLPRSPRALRSAMTGLFTGTPAKYYRDDSGGNLAFAEALGSLFISTSARHPNVEIDYRRFILGDDRERPVILVWGERDGTRILDPGEWGAKATAVYDAKALYQRLLAEITEGLRDRDDLPADEAAENARKLVQLSVVLGAGHEGIHTESHMGAFVERIVEHLRDTDVVP